MTAFFVSVVFDEEHRSTSTVDAETPDAAKASLLQEFLMQERDVISIEATPVLGTKPGRPIEREGRYRRITLEIREDLLAKIDASGKSRREFIEQFLESL